MGEKNKYLTINQAAKETGIAEYHLRQLVKQRRVPGFYAGTRFYINVDLFLEQLEGECRANATGYMEKDQDGK